MQPRCTGNPWFTRATDRHGVALDLRRRAQAALQQDRRCAMGTGGQQHLDET